MSAPAYAPPPEVPCSVPVKFFVKTAKGGRKTGSTARRLLLSGSDCRFALISALAAGYLRKPDATEPEAVTVQYEDADGDFVTISAEEEWHECLRDHASRAGYFPTATALPLHVRPGGCDEGERAKKRPSRRQPLAVQFRNNHDACVSVYWNDPHQGEVAYTTIRPHTAVWQQTWSGHRWTFRNADAEACAFGEFQADGSSDRCTVSVTPEGVLDVSSALL
ncbi:hypothetical protein DIPPA_15782 [Diplonema papillatum]|nr:hypothetical protein DIPPA_13783 [Diplonema papillatum]KAJ9446053.1 hypothetical protein DIPPA_15782 [Diplonema papillatum]